MTKTNELRTRTETISALALGARQIGDTHDIFSGEKLSRKELIRFDENRHKPLGTNFSPNKSYLFEPGTGGRLYCVRFRCDFREQLDIGLTRADDQLNEKQRESYVQKGLDEDEISILLDHIKSFQSGLRYVIRDLFTLGTDNYGASGHLSENNLNPHVYHIESGIDGIFLAGERNLRLQTSLRDLMQSSAISKQLGAGLQAIEYQKEVGAFLDYDIPVESKMVDAIGIANAYATGVNYLPRDIELELNFCQGR